MTNKLTTLHMTGAQIQEAFREEQIVARNERTYYISPVPNNWKRVCEVEDV